MSDETPGLTWFEIQVCPFEFRLAVVPGQAILIGTEGGTSLVPRDQAQLCADIIAALNDLVRECSIFDTPMRRPNSAFEDDAAMAKPSLHLRAAYGEEERWASVYPLSKVPPNVNAVLEGCRQLAEQIERTCPSREVDPQAARLLTRPDAPLARVKVARTNEIFLDGTPATLDDVRAAVARIKAGNGGVLYHREDPDTEASDDAMAVFELIIQAGLPIKLCEKDFGEPGCEDGEFLFPGPG